MSFPRTVPILSLQPKPHQFARSAVSGHQNWPQRIFTLIVKHPGDFLGWECAETHRASPTTAQEVARRGRMGRRRVGGQGAEEMGPPALLPWLRGFQVIREEGAVGSHGHAEGSIVRIEDEARACGPA